MKNAIAAAITARIASLSASANMWRVVVSTQFMENYGSHDWDGTGECPQGWKYKGGRDIVVASRGEAISHSEAESIALAWQGHSSDYSEEYRTGWSLLAPGELTGDEQDRIDWDPALAGLRDLLEQAERIEARLEWEAEQEDLLEEEAHDRGRARP